MLKTLAAPAVAIVLAATAISPTQAVADNRPAAYQTERAGIAVSLMGSPQMLRGKQVVDAHGRAIGRVVSVAVDREGKAEVVNIEVGGLLNLGTRVIPFAADRIVYFPTQATLVASNEPSPVRAPPLNPDAPERASVKMPAPSPTIIRN